jgi:hypothetical protein
LAYAASAIRERTTQNEVVRFGKSTPRYLTDEPPGTGILGGRPLDLHFNLKQPIDAEAALGIRPDAQPAGAEERAERRAALIRVASVERGRVSQPDPKPLRRMSTPAYLARSAWQSAG